MNYTYLYIRYIKFYSSFHITRIDSLLSRSGRVAWKIFPVKEEQVDDFSSPSSRSNGDRIDRVSRGVKSKQAAEREGQVFAGPTSKWTPFSCRRRYERPWINQQWPRPRDTCDCQLRAKWMKWMKSREGGEVQEFWGGSVDSRLISVNACQRGFWQGTSKGLRWEIEKRGRMIYGSRIFFWLPFEWCFRAKTFEMVEKYRLT